MNSPQPTPPEKNSLVDGFTAETEFLRSKLLGISKDSLATLNPARVGVTFLELEGINPAELKAREDLRPKVPIEHEFELKTIIARGGMGEVWHATQGALNREIAVKTLLLSNLSGSPEELAEYERAFHAEAILTANLSHPNILPIHDLGKSNSGNLLLAMKLVRGITWDDQLKKDFKGMDEGSYVRKHLTILMDVCKALNYAHSRGVIHRDLKPQQVMVGEFGEVQLMDWGLGVIIDPRMAREYMPSVFSAAKEQGIPIPLQETCINPAGTPSYMAPEQCDFDSKRLGFWTDIFLIGSILYRILTGRPPYSTGNSVESMVLARLCHRTPMTQLAPDRWIPWELEQLVNWCMNPDPMHRPRTIAQVIEVLTDYLAKAERRWDSVDLTQNVANSVGSSHITAAYLSGLSTQLDQAQILWPENPAIEGLRNKVAAAFAHYVATKNQEVTRALLQAEHVTDRNLRDYLVAYLERAYATEMRKRWLIPDLLAFFMTLIGLLCVVALLVIIF